MLWMNRIVNTLLGGVFVGAILLLGSACAPSLPGSVTLVKSVLETPVSAISIYDNKWLYVIDENGKLISYDVSSPENPKKGSQVDAFKDESFQIGYERSSQWLVLVGKSGKFMLFDIRDPESPTPIWGNGKTYKLKKVGPMMIRPDIPSMYLTPGNGTALVRVNLAALGTAVTDQAAVDAATFTFSGEGGGGVVMPFSRENTAIRIYVGNKKSGKLDVWNITQIEAKKADAKPISSVALKAGTDVADLFVYQKDAKANQRWVVARSTSGDLEYLDLGKNEKSADEPKSVGTASVPGFISVQTADGVMVGEELSVWDFSKDFKAPVKVGKPEISAALSLRSVVIHKGHIYTGEASGFNVYSFSKGSK